MRVDKSFFIPPLSSQNPRLVQVIVELEEFMPVIII